MLQAIIIGNLGADAEVKTTGNGNQFVSFRVAHTERFTDKSTGEIREKTEWISCTMNGNGGNVLQHLKSGTKVYIQGSIQTKLYVSSRDGKQYAGINCSVWQLELCGSKRVATEFTPDSIAQYINQCPENILAQLKEKLEEHSQPF